MLPEGVDATVLISAWASTQMTQKSSGFPRTLAMAEIVLAQGRKERQPKKHKTAGELLVAQNLREGKKKTSSPSI
jgi:hypothetical protein